jgi:hypothetical protein
MLGTVLAGQIMGLLQGEHTRVRPVLYSRIAVIRADTAAAVVRSHMACLPVWLNRSHHILLLQRPCLLLLVAADVAKCTIYGSMVVTMQCMQAPTLGSAQQSR